MACWSRPVYGSSRRSTGGLWSGPGRSPVAVSCHVNRSSPSCAVEGGLLDQEAQGHDGTDRGRCTWRHRSSGFHCQSPVIVGQWLVGREKPILRRASSGSCSRSCPPTEALPSVARLRPASILMKVVLPAPLGPTSTTELPCATSMLMPRRAAVAANDLTRPLTSIIDAS